MNNRSLGYKKSDIAIIIIVSIFCVAAILFSSAKSNSYNNRANFAVVTVNGQVVTAIDLGDYSSSTPQLIDLKQWGVDGKLELKECMVRFVEVDCPDHICENQGFIGKGLQSAVCMPNRTSVIIYSPKEAREFLKQ